MEIGRHTDDVGNEADNLSLSQRRADAVLNHLTSAGVDRDALEAKGYGDPGPGQTMPQRTAGPETGGRNSESSETEAPPAMWRG